MTTLAEPEQVTEQQGEPSPAVSTIEDAAALIAVRYDAHVTPEWEVAEDDGLVVATPPDRSICFLVNGKASCTAQAGWSIW